MSKTVEDIGTLKINLLSQAQYDAEKAGGRLADDELYLTPSSGTGVSDVEVNGSSVVSGGVAEIELKTINLNSIVGSGDIEIQGGASAFVAEYGVTTYADIKDAYDEDAIIICTVDDSGNTAICQLAYFDDANDTFIFAQPISDGFYLASIASDDTWDDSYFQFASTDTATQLRDGLMDALDKQKLDGIASGAEVNVQSNWSQSDSTADDYIKNKPTIPTVNNATLTIQKNGTTVNTFTANASSNVTANITVPTDTGDLTNGAGYITGYTETDPTVPSWAKQSTKPTYTANEVGAQPTLVSGTNIKTINNESLLGSGNITVSAEDEIFYCDFETTTLAEAVTAYNAGKTLLCRYTDDVVFYAPLVSVALLNGSVEGFAFSVGGYGSSISFLLSSTGWNQMQMSATSTPTANKLPLFDANAKMNSTDMTSQEVSDFVGNLGYSFNLIDMFYPVGSYYETSDSTFNPNITWGGTWVLETEGQVHVSAGVNYDVGDTGGVASHTHTTGDFTLTTSHIPAHTHGSQTISFNFTSRRQGSNSQSFWGGTNTTVSAGSSGVTSNAVGTGSQTSDKVSMSQAHTHTSVGGGGAHNHGATGSGSNMQPYIVVNRWHRTA